MLHKTLDAAAPGMIRVPHPSADLGLQFEGQALFGAAGEVVQVTSNRPEEFLGAINMLRFFFGQHPQIDELVDLVGAINVFGYPEQCVEVPKTAFTLLDVGLELVPA